MDYLGSIGLRLFFKDTQMTGKTKICLLSGYILVEKKVRFSLLKRYFSRE